MHLTEHPRWLRLYAALLGAAIPAPVALVGAVLQVDLLLFGAAFGAATGGLIGLLVAPRALAAPRPIRFAVRLGLGAPMLGAGVLFGGFAIVGVLITVSTPGPDVGRILGPLLFVPIAVLGALVTLPITALPAIAASIIAVTLLRWATKGSGERATGVLASAIGLAMVAVAMTIPLRAAHEARAAFGTEDGPLALAAAEVRLEVAVVNHRRTPITVITGQREADGEGGAIGGVGPCEVGRSSLATAHGWFVRVGPESEGMADDPWVSTPLVADAGGFPGHDVRLLIEVAADGSTVARSANGALPDGGPGVMACG